MPHHAPSTRLPSSLALAALLAAALAAPPEARAETPAPAAKASPSTSPPARWTRCCWASRDRAAC
ncbi:hypothetical protein P4114_25530 [Pseudomonas aeruginosa]|nr:hypothetical protein [Pseudomonas aeruginosa]